MPALIPVQITVGLVCTHCYGPVLILVFLIVVHGCGGGLLLLCEVPYLQFLVHSHFYRLMKIERLLL